MTLKNLFFKLIREDAKRRLWVLALSVIMFFFTFPVNISLMISRYTYRGMDNFDDVLKGTEYVNKAIVNGFLSWTSAGNGAMVFLMCTLAVLCATSGFSYLHSRKKTDFYHSLPIKREKLFAVTFLCGILFTAIPYLIALFVTTLIVQVKTGMAFSWGSVFAGYMIHMAFYLLIYATVVAAVILTGNTVVSLLGTIVFFSWGPSVVAVIFAYCQQYYRTFYYMDSPLERLAIRSSPVSYYISAMEKTVVESGENLKMAAIAFGIAVLITLVTLLLYKIRPSEGAGRAMAFKKSQAVIKFLLVVPAALFGSLFMRQMQDTSGWSIFGLLCGLILSYSVIEIIYNFDFRKLFSHKLQLILCTVVSFGILAFFSFDLSGYDSYLPSADRIESAAIVSRTVDGDSADEYWAKPYLVSYNNDFDTSKERHYINWRGGGDEVLLKDMKLTDTEHVLAIAQKGNEAVKELRKKNLDRYSDIHHDADVRYSDVYIKYQLKGGKAVYRSYYMDYNQIAESFSPIYAQREYKETVYPILKEDISRIAGINYQEYKDYRHVNLPDDSMKEKLLTTYKEELLGLTIKTRNEESPIAAIQFKTHDIQALIDQLKSEGDTREYLRFNDWYYYPVYPSFTKTIALLQECGINAGTFLNAENVEKIEMTGNLDFYKYDYREVSHPEAISEPTYTENDRKSLIIKDKNQIEAILKASYSKDLNRRNDLNKAYDNISVTAFVRYDKLNKSSDILDVVNNSSDETYTSRYGDKDERDSAEYETYGLMLDTDKVPAFVKEAMPLSFD